MLSNQKITKFLNSITSDTVKIATLRLLSDYTVVTITLHLHNLPSTALWSDMHYDYVNMAEKSLSISDYFFNFIHFTKKSAKLLKGYIQGLLS